MSVQVLPKFTAGVKASLANFNAPLVASDDNFSYLESQLLSITQQLNALQSAVSGVGDMLRSNYANTSTTVVDKAFALRIPSEEYDLSGEDVYSHLNNSALHSGGTTLTFCYDVVETRQFTPAYTVSWGRGIYNLRSTNGYPLTLSVSVDSGVTWRMLGNASSFNSSSFIVFVQNGYQIIDRGGYYPQTEVVRIISF